MRGDNRIAQVSASHINENAEKFDISFQRETGLIPIHSVKDLADSLKRFNTSLDDTVIVYCRGTNEHDM